MKIGTTKDKILRAILLAERIVGKKESLPILSCILIEAKEELCIRATNLEAGIEIRIPAEIEEAGTLAVSATVLSQTIRSISADRVVFKNEEQNLLIESRGTKTLIKAVPHDEFPSFNSKESELKGVRVSREKFMRALQAVSYAASPSMIRPELGSVYVALKDKTITCVATDSFRLAEKTVSQSIDKDGGDILIPLKHAQELIHVLERIESEEITIYTDDSQMVVEGDMVRFVSRVIDGTFPNYREILPKKFSTEATVLKSDFVDILRKARVFSGNDQHVGLHVYPNRKIFTATAQSPDVGEMSDSIDAAITGEDLDINFHIGYLGDCLSSIESDSIILGFSGVGKAVVLRGVSDASFTYLVMPLNR